MINPLKIHWITALKTGLLAMAIFLALLSLFGEGITELSFLLFALIFGSIFTTLIAFMSSMLLFNFFEMINSNFKLNLSPQAMYYYFLPFMIFSSGLITVVLWMQGFSEFPKALTFTIDISALLGWSIYTFEKLKVSSNKTVDQTP